MTPLPLASTDDVVSHLERARDGAPSGILAMDADGTLWAGDVGEDAFELLLERRGVRVEALDELRAVAAANGVPLADDANAQAGLLARAHAARAIPDRVAYEAMAWVTAGHTRAEIAALADDAIASRRLANRLHPELAPVLAWAERASVPVVVVSASPRLVVERAVALLGLRIHAVVGMVPRVAPDGRVAAGLVPPVPYAEGKPVALRAVTDATLLGAFGDSGFDADLLRLADVRVAVRPKPSLRERAAEIPGLLELARPTP